MSSKVKDIQKYIKLKNNQRHYTKEVHQNIDDQEENMNTKKEQTQKGFNFYSMFQNKALHSANQEIASSQNK